jgi:hypothetical protein
MGWEAGEGRGNGGIAGEDLRNFVPAPVTGGSPQFYFGTAGYSGTVEWADGEAPLEGVFGAETAYTAAVTLRAASGYTFAGVPAAPGAGSFTHSRSAEISHGAGGGAELRVVIGFPATGAGGYYVADYDLQHYVPAPVAGARPVRSVTRLDLEGEIVWKEKGAEAPLGEGFAAFAEGGEYQAAITLKALEPYRFAAIPFGYAEGAAEVLPPPALGERERALSVTYPAAGEGREVSAANLDLALYLPAPGAGETAVRSFAAAGYTGTVAWKTGPGFGGDMAGNLFQPGTAYRADVTLYAAPGFTLEGAAFTHSKGIMSNEEQGTGGNGEKMVSIVFPATAVVPVDDLELDLSKYLPAPVRGGTPVLDFYAPQYTGTAAWEGTESGAAHSGPFEADTKYTAKVTLTAAAGRSFGTGAAAFTHSRAESPPGISVSDNDGASIKVTVPFTATTDAAAAPADDLDLSKYLPAPVTGGTPVTYFPAPQYTGAAAWTPADGVFQAGKAYTAEVTLTAASGYTLAGVTGWTHSGGTLSWDPGAGKAVIAFPAGAGSGGGKPEEIEVEVKW